jgi:plastocyanin
MIMKSVLTVAFAAGLFLLSPPASLAQKTVNVEMTSGLRFDPPDVLIQAGDTVLWTNTSTIIPHTASAEEGQPGGFNSGYFPRKWLFPGDTFQFTFTTPGVYNYFCLPHKSLAMVGRVTVNGNPVAPKYFFTAAPLADEEQILVRWNVPRNRPRVGFNILRSTGWDQQFVTVNDGVIRLESQDGVGENFRFVDARNIAPGTTYYYVVEEVRLDGQESFRGPAIAKHR